MGNVLWAIITYKLCFYGSVYFQLQENTRNAESRRAEGNCSFQQRGDGHQQEVWRYEVVWGRTMGMLLSPGPSEGRGAFSMGSSS